METWLDNTLEEGGSHLLPWENLEYHNTQDKHS